MLVPLSWLRDFAPFDLEPVALGEVFDDLGMVVEGLTRVGDGLEDVVVSRVVSVGAIDGADRIRRVLVDAGGPEPVQVVCGAWNFGVGDTVGLARVGAVLPGDLAIARRKMKGVVSDGMLCSARELGLGDDAAGLLVLPTGLAPGRPVAEALGVEADVVFDLAIEANRPDANCIVGVARDAAARLGMPFVLPTPAGDGVAGTGGGHAADGASFGPGSGGARGGAREAADRFTIEVSAPELCDRFTVGVFSGVAVGASPQWVVRRLTLAGMRPISNVVDASNYVMLELGQPTHAYDLDRLPSPALRVRAARAGEHVITLDGVDRVLGQGTHPDCVICDGEDRAIGIAGIMGGAACEVEDATVRVALEAAHFVPMAIARTSKRLGLRSEASARFERGVDIEGIGRAMGRFADVLGSTSPSPGAGRPPDRSGPPSSPGSGPAMPVMEDWRAPGAGVRPRIRLRTARVNAVLGTGLVEEQITRLLTPIGFEVGPDGPGVLEVVPPSFRPDAVTEIDVVEEVARHHGYSRIPRTTVRPAQVGALSAYQRARRLTREVLAGAGLSEAMGSPLVGPGDHARAGLPEDGIGAVDPLAREESILRTSLLPGLLRAASYNADRRSADLGLFEIGHVWRASAAGDGDAAWASDPRGGPRPNAGHGLPDEREMVAVAVAGLGPAGLGTGAPAAVLVLRRLAAALRIAGLVLAAGEAPGLHPTRTAAVAVAGRPAGWVGEVDPDVASAWGLDGRVGWLEVELPVLVAGSRGADRARPVSRFPSSDIDLAFVVDDHEPAGAVEATLAQSAGGMLERLALFDVYRGPGVALEARSLAFRLRLVAEDRTLTDAEVGELRKRCIQAVESAHPATLRD